MLGTAVCAGHHVIPVILGHPLITFALLSSECEIKPKETSDLGRVTLVTSRVKLAESWAGCPCCALLQMLSASPLRKLCSFLSLGTHRGDGQHKNNLSKPPVDYCMAA